MLSECSRRSVPAGAAAAGDATPATPTATAAASATPVNGFIVITDVITDLITTLNVGWSTSIRRCPDPASTPPSVNMPAHDARPRSRPFDRRGRRPRVPGAAHARDAD